MDEQSSDSQDDSTSNVSNTSHIFNQFQDLYTQNLNEIDDSNDGLKTKIQILEAWVKDLTEQNVLLIKTVGELENEALKKISMLEENLTKAPLTVPDTSADSQVVAHLSPDSQVVAHLCNDINNLLEILRRLREEGFWYLDGLEFKTVSYEDIFGIPPWECKCEPNIDKPKRHCWSVKLSPSCSSTDRKTVCCCCHP